MTRPPTARLEGLDRRTVIAGSLAVAAAVPFAALGGCSASAQGDSLEAAVAALARLDPLRPEDFGATGRTGDDQTAALGAMMAEARRRGRARVQFQPRATYAGTNPFIWGGLAELLIEGRGATLVTARAATSMTTFAANFAPFRSPMPILPNGIEPLGVDASQDFAKLDFGMRIRSARRGATMLESLDGSPLPTGRLLVYGWDRMGIDSVPPCPSCFEWVTATVVSGRRNTVRLSTPLGAAYDENAPDVAAPNDPTQRYGAARVMGLDRAQGRFRAFAEMNLLAIRDVVFARSAQIRIAGSETFNGVAGFGGARDVLLENVTAPRLFVTCAERVRMRGVRVAEDLEIDKLLGRVEIEDSTIGSLVGALGAREVHLGAGTKVLRGTWLGPIDSLVAQGAQFGGDAGSPRALIGFYAHGSRAVRLERCMFIADDPQNDRLVEAQFFEAQFRGVVPGELAIARAEFQRSGIFRNLFVGATLFDAANRPVARISRMPWCPDGDVLHGDVRVGVEERVPLPRSSRLRLPVIAGLSIVEPTIAGPFAANVAAVFGTDSSRTGNSILATVDGLEIGAKAIRFDSSVAGFDRPGHTFTIVLGRSFVPTLLRFEIVGSGASRSPLLIAADDDSGRDVAMLRAVNPQSLGERRVSGNSAALKPGDVAGLFPATGISAIRVIDPTRAGGTTARARWRLVLEGAFR